MSKNNQLSVDKAQVRVDIASDMLAHVKELANRERKASCEPHIRSHYSKAIAEIDAECASAKAVLIRCQALVTEK